MSEWHVYQLNECDWWVARSMEEAQADYAKECGADIEDPHELDDAEMGRRTFVDCDEDESEIDGGRRSFREELERRVAAGLASPGPFASTEN